MWDKRKEEIRSVLPYVFTPEIFTEPIENIISQEKELLYEFAREILNKFFFDYAITDTGQEHFKIVLNNLLKQYNVDKVLQ